MPAFGLIHPSKSETTGPAEWVRGSNPAALGSSFSGARGTVPVPSRPATLLSPSPVTVLSCPVSLFSSYLHVPSSPVIILYIPFQIPSTLPCPVTVAYHCLQVTFLSRILSCPALSRYPCCTALSNYLPTPLISYRFRDGFFQLPSCPAL